MSTLRVVTTVSTLRVTSGGQPALVVTASPSAVVRVSQVGLRGPPGTPGEAGPPGQDGADGEAQIPEILDGGNF